MERRQKKISRKMEGNLWVYEGARCMNINYSLPVRIKSFTRSSADQPGRKNIISKELVYLSVKAF